MRAPSSSASGWHDTSGRAIVNRMRPKSPRARRSRMCRSVPAYASARVDADRVEPELVREPLELSRRHRRIVHPTPPGPSDGVPRRRTADGGILWNARRAPRRTMAGTEVTPSQFRDSDRSPDTASCRRARRRTRDHRRPAPVRRAAAAAASTSAASTACAPLAVDRGAALPRGQRLAPRRLPRRRPLLRDLGLPDHDADARGAARAPGRSRSATSSLRRARRLLPALALVLRRRRSSLSALFWRDALAEVQSGVLASALYVRTGG